MLENLIELVRENVQESVVNNSDVPNEQNEAVIQAATGSIFDTLKDQISSGNIGALADVFNSGNTGGTAVTQQATDSFTDKLTGLGINSTVIKTLAASIIPMIIGKLTQKTADPNDSSFNITDILGKLGGGADGKFDVTDVIGMFTGGQQNSPDGQVADDGILDKLKGMFG